MGCIRSSDIYFVTKGDVIKKESAGNFSTLSKWSIKDKQIRCYDECAKKLTHEPLTNIYIYGEAEIFRIRTQDDYDISLTGDCSILTIDGWKHVNELAVGDVVLENGQSDPPYKDKKTLEMLYVSKGKTQKEIADMFGVKPRTIRAWVDRFDLHRGDAGALFGSDNPAWKGDDISKLGGYDRTHRQEDGTLANTCSRCGAVGDVHIHHRNRDPTDTSPSNLEVLCPMCHKAEHHGAIVRWCRPAEITSVKSVGYASTVGFNTMKNNVIIGGLIVGFDKAGSKGGKDFDIHV